MNRLAAKAICMLAYSLACGCDIPTNLTSQDVYTGNEARDRILRWHKLADSDDLPKLPESTGDFYLYDGGSYSGVITYWSFKCDNAEDCWAALTALRGVPSKSEFKPWQPSRFAVVMRGPGFYSSEFATDKWNVKTIQNGMVYEDVQGGNERMYYYAVDFDTSRVYCHKESGGFPTTPYKPTK